MIARRAVLHALVCAALVASTSGCAFVARALVAVEALDVAHDAIQDDRPTPLGSPTTETSGTVTGTGGSGLRLRSTPGGDRVDGLPEGSVVTVLCTVDGPNVAGPRGATSTWSKVRLAGGATGYVSNAYLDVSGPSVPGC